MDQLEKVLASEPVDTLKMIELVCDGNVAYCEDNNVSGEVRMSKTKGIIRTEQGSYKSTLKLSPFIMNSKWKVVPGKIESFDRLFREINGCKNVFCVIKDKTYEYRKNAITKVVFGKRYNDESYKEITSKELWEQFLEGDWYVKLK